MFTYILGPGRILLLVAALATVGVPHEKKASAFRPHEATPLSDKVQKGENDAFVLTHWLAFFATAPGADLEEADGMMGEEFVCVLQDGTVIWNDAPYRRTGAYYPSTVRNGTARNPDQWRRGKADPERLRALTALLTTNRFFTDEVDYRVSRGEDPVIRLGVPSQMSPPNQPVQAV